MTAAPKVIEEQQTLPEVYGLANALFGVFIFALLGIVFWWLGGRRLVGRLLGGSRGSYSKVSDDVEK